MATFIKYVGPFINSKGVAIYDAGDRSRMIIAETSDGDQLPGTHRILYSAGEYANFTDHISESGQLSADDANTTLRALVLCGMPWTT